MNSTMWKMLLSPLAYLRIRHSDKMISDWVYPIGLAIVSTAILSIFGNPGWLAGSGGLLDRLLTFTAVLPGFFIAALAAISTFNRPDIDEMMPAPAPTLVIELRGNSNVINLTRRRFLAHLFSFLCWESLLLMLACTFGALISKGVAAILLAHPLAWARPCAAFVLLFLLWQVVSATCLGLYYLGDRLNRPTS